MLARAKKFARTTLLQIALRDFESIGSCDHGFDPVARIAGDRFRCDENAVRFLRASANPPTQLMKLCEAKTVGMLDRYRRTARHFDELQLGSLVDLVEGLGWVTSWVIPPTSGADETDLSIEDHEGFRHRDSNPNKRIQNPLSCH